MACRRQGSSSARLTLEISSGSPTNSSAGVSTPYRSPGPRDALDNMLGIDRVVSVVSVSRKYTGDLGGGMGRGRDGAGSISASASLLNLLGKKREVGNKYKELDLQVGSATMID